MSLFGRVSCGECSAPMQLVDATAKDRYQEGRAFWRCTRFPNCPGTHGAHPNGDPLGIPANRETNAARFEAHEVFDRLWQDRLVPSRKDAYVWLRRVMRMSDEEAHFSRFDIATCEKAVTFALMFIEQWTPTASPIVNVFPDPWDLVPVGVDPDDLRMVPSVDAAAPMQQQQALAEPSSCSSVDVFIEQPDGW